MQEFMPQAIEFAQKHTFLTIAWFAVLFMTLFTFFKSATQKYRVITNPEAVRLMNDEEAVVIDYVLLMNSNAAISLVASTCFQLKLKIKM